MAVTVTLPAACVSHTYETHVVEPQGQGGSGFEQQSQAGFANGAGTAMSGYDIYLDAFHVTKDQPSRSMEAHHYCKAVNQDLTQCMLFDKGTPDARLIGIEYIISEQLFETLPPQERPFWHPHNYEILSGQLVIPGAPEAAEKKALAGKMNSYGKTWHVWQERVPGIPSNSLPVGAPTLEWSFNADGEAPQSLIDQRDRRLGISTADKRAQRTDLTPLAHPQEGVDALAPAFPNRQPIPGVVDKSSPVTSQRVSPEQTPGWR
jgi:hypothetical protein